jgi:photosystem II stability/assembly factor-like uncharacterized protein
MASIRRSHLLANAALVLLSIAAVSCARWPAAPAWKVTEIPTDADFAGVCFTDTLNGWLTGGGWDIDGGIVARTRDGGRTWRFQTGVAPSGGRGFGFGRVSFRDATHGCVVASDGVVRLTDDGGESWRPAIYSAADGIGLYDLRIRDEHDAWAAGPGAIVHSSDGGEHWEMLARSTSENGYLAAYALDFVTSWEGWLVSHNGLLMRTNDAGYHWTPVALPLPKGERPTLRDIQFIDRRRGWVVGERGAIFHTEDGGITWRRQENGVPAVRVLAKGERRRHEVVPELETEPDRLAISAVRFADAQRGWAVGSYADVAESVVLGTHDGGATWIVEHAQKGELLRSLCVLDSSHAWAAGDRARTTPQVVLRYAPNER